MRQAVVNFRELAERVDSAPTGQGEAGMMSVPLPGPDDLPVPDGAIASGGERNAASATSATAALPSPTPSASFLALADDGTRFPPNPSAALGPNHLVVMADSQTRILTKTGTVITTVSTASFWASLGSSLVFESRGFYDTASGRFVFVILADPQTANSALLIAVSQTSDPTGNWTLSRVNFDPQGQVFADWPNVGFNKNWVVVTANAFNVAPPNNFNRAQIFVFDRSKLSSSNPSFTVIQDTTGGGSLAPAKTYDDTQATEYVLGNWNGNLNERGVLRLGAITSVVGSPEYAAALFFPSVTSTWASTSPGNADFAPQRGSDKKIYAGDARIQTVSYTNGSLFGAQTVFIPANAPDRCAARWFEINPANGAILQDGRVDDPTGKKNTYYPSIEIASNGDLGMTYLESSASEFLSMYVTGRTVTDPPNTLSDGVLAKAGEAPYYRPTASGRNAWGNYSATVLDPDGSTILACNEVPPASIGGDRWSLYAALLAEPAVQGTTELKVDSGRLGNTFGLQGGGTYHIFNNLKPANEAALTITGVNIYWPSQGGLTVGTPFTLNVAINPSGSDNLDGISYQNIPAQVNSLNQFNNYSLIGPIGVERGSSIVVGAKITQPTNIFPFAFDDTPSQGKTFISTDGVHFTPTTTLGIQGNAMIRAVVATTPACSVTLDQNERFFDALGKSDAVLTGHSQCKPNNVTPSDTWIHIKEVGVFSGGFSVGYSVEPTPFSDPRTGRIKIEDQTFTVYQAGSEPLQPVTLSPSSIPAGGTGIKLMVNRAGSNNNSKATVNATGFTSNSIVGWNGEARPTTLVSGTQLTAQISTADIATPGTARVTVFDFSPGGGTSPPVTFTVTAAGPDFSLSFDQATVSAQAGTKARVTVNINRTGGFTGNVTVTPPDPAGGIKPKPADPITTTDTTASFKLKIGGGAAPGPHQLVFKGKDDTGRERTVTLTLVVQ